MAVTLVWTSLKSINYRPIEFLHWQSKGTIYDENVLVMWFYITSWWRYRSYLDTFCECRVGFKQATSNLSNLVRFTKATKNGNGESRLDFCGAWERTSRNISD